MSFYNRHFCVTANNSARGTLAAAASALTLFLLSGHAYGQTAPPVPSEYQALASEMQTNLSGFTASMQASWNGVRAPVLYSSQLRTASSNEGSGLLAASHQSRVTAELDAMQALGVNAVTIHIDFPLFYASYYSNSTELEQYEQFYTALASEIRARGLKLIVETQLMKFSAPQLAYAKGLSWTAYQAGRAQNAVTVAKLLRPDYMVVITEPDTELSFSGQAPVGTISGSVQLLSTILAALQAAGVGGVPVGAGVGTWSANPTAWLTAYAALPVAFLDMHVYPTNRSFLPNALAMADVAHKFGKPIAMSETWLQKVADSELSGNVMSTDSRNPFSYWAPLDAQFLHAMVMLANYKQFTFLSPFWTAYYYAYSSSTEDAADQEAAQANAIGQYTSTGLAYETAILPAPDTSAPQVPAPPAARKSGSAVQLTWQPDTDNVGVAGYNVFRSGKALAKTSGTSYNDAAPPAGPVSYSLSAFDAAGHTSPTSATTQIGGR